MYFPKYNVTKTTLTTSPLTVAYKMKAYVCIDYNYLFKKSTENTKVKKTTSSPPPTKKFVIIHVLYS